ncbi:MAG: hypothetical protein ACUVQ8_04935 [Nitrososphaeria archaeon]
MFKPPRPQQDWRPALRAQVSQDLSKLLQVEEQVNWLSGSIAYVDSMTTSLPSRFKALRANGFVHRLSVEKQMNDLVGKWNITRLNLSTEVESFSKQLKTEIDSLKSEADVLLHKVNQPFTIEPLVRVEVASFNSRIGGFTSKASGQIEQARAGLTELRQSIEKIEKVVGEAEYSVKMAKSASFTLMEKEHPLLCVKAKKQEPGQKNEGRIIVTDQRLLYEVEREVVVEKKLFIATKTKIDRALDLEIPLGIVSGAHKGRVGLIAWEGVYIELRPGQKFKEAVFDTTGDDTEKLIETIDYVLSGQADKDMVVTEAEQRPVEGPKAFFCIKCGAPLDVATTRGISEATCKYCGTKNKIQ